MESAYRPLLRLDGRNVLIIGLSHGNGNLARLRAGEPLKPIDCRPYGLDTDLMIFSGPTEQSMAEALMQFQPGLTPTPDPQTEG